MKSVFDPQHFRDVSGTLTIEDYASIIPRMKRNIRKRMDRILKIDREKGSFSDTQHPLYTAYRQFTELEQEIAGELQFLPKHSYKEAFTRNPKLAKKWKAKLEYINRLKTSRVKGYTEERGRHERLKEAIGTNDDFANKLLDRGYQVFSHMLNNNPDLESYKYEIAEIAAQAFSDIAMSDPTLLSLLKRDDKLSPEEQEIIDRYVEEISKKIDKLYKGIEKKVINISNLKEINQQKEIARRLAQARIKIRVLDPDDLKHTEKGEKNNL